jgi:hyperosmotically inducible protein
MRTMKSKALALVAMFVISSAVAVAGTATDPSGNQQIPRQVRHELLTLPYYGVFDNLAYKVDGDTVTLYGQVVRPTTRSDAARNVAGIPGVSHVINNIEVLPLSPFDDSIRRSAYRTVFSRGGLYRYAQGANPSIHIIVDNGNLTLEGVVSNKMDSQLAYIAARSVPNVFSVTNNLHVDGSGAY